MSASTAKFKFPKICEAEKTLREQKKAETIERWRKILEGDEDLLSEEDPDVLYLLYPDDVDVEPITSPEDIIWLARQLLDWDGVPEVLKQVGEHGDMTYEENRFVREVLIHVAKPFRRPGHYGSNLEIAIALARSVMSGRISSLGDKGAIEFVQDRLRTFTSQNWPDADVRPPRLSELLQILENIKRNRPEIIARLDEVHRLPADAPERRDIEIYDLGVVGIASTEASKYGLANRHMSGLDILETVMARYAWGFGPDDLERDSVLAELRQNFMKFRDWQRLIDDI